MRCTSPLLSHLIPLFSVIRTLRSNASGDTIDSTQCGLRRPGSSTQHKLWLIQPQLPVSRHCLFLKYVILFYLVLRSAWARGCNPYLGCSGR